MNRAYHIVDIEGTVRFDRYLRGMFPGITQALIEKLLRKGLILLNDCIVSSSARVKTGDVVGVGDINFVPSYSKKEEKDVSASLLKLMEDSVIYKDEYVIAVNKPAGLSVQGGTKVRESIGDLLHEVIPGEQLHIVHRLDKDTSGVLVLARRISVARSLSEELRCRRVKKEYLAITEGVPLCDSGTIDLPIFYKRPSPKVGNTALAKDAKTSFFRVKSYGNYSIILLRPVTGRKHQLRIHLSQNGCPIIGDSKYNYEGLSKGKLHLHALRMTFEIFDKSITITAPVPMYIEETVRTIFGCSLESTGITA